MRVRDQIRAAGVGDLGKLGYEVRLPVLGTEKSGNRVFVFKSEERRKGLWNLSRLRRITSLPL